MVKGVPSQHTPAKEPMIKQGYVGMYSSFRSIMFMI